MPLYNAGRLLTQGSTFKTNFPFTLFRLLLDDPSAVDLAWCLFISTSRVTCFENIQKPLHFLHRWGLFDCERCKTFRPWIFQKHNTVKTASTILLVSEYSRFWVNWMFCTYSPFIKNGISLIGRDGCSAQMTHLGLQVQSKSLRFSTQHFRHLAFLLHLQPWCLNFWLLKQNSGLGIYCSTEPFKHAISMLEGMFSL